MRTLNQKYQWQSPERGCPSRRLSKITLIVLIFSLLISASTTQTQTKSLIRGTVIDEKKAPLTTVRKSEPVTGPDFTDTKAVKDRVNLQQTFGAAIDASRVEQCLKDFESITNGMTRAEVESKLRQDGGLQSVSPVRYVHPACSYFKINVEFDFKRDAADQTRAIMGKDDKAIRVSKPYLERPFSD